MALHPAPEAVSFDCYGTLVDWETGLERSLLWILREKPDSPGLEEVLAAWARHERALTGGKEAYRRYREVLSEALRLAFEELGVPWHPRDGSRLAAAMGSWEPFDDAPGALGELRDLGYKLAVFSNTDEAILAASAKRLRVRFDLLLAAEEVKAYKPDERVFWVGLKRLGLPAERVLHVSASPYHDLEPAKRVGLRTFWVDRKGLGECGVEPDFVGRDLRALAALLGPG